MEKKFEFTPKQWILVREKNTHNLWGLTQYSHIAYECYLVTTACMSFDLGLFEVIPYEGNENLIGTRDDYEEDYVPEDGDFVVSRVQSEDFKNRVFIFSQKGSNKEFGACRCGFYPRTGRLYTPGCSTGYCSGWARFPFRKATEEEKKELLDALKKESVYWDAENKLVVDYKRGMKDGDFLWSGDPFGDLWHIGIFRKNLSMTTHSEYVTYRNALNYVKAEDKEYQFGSENMRPATEEERRLLLDAMHDAGMDWDAEEKKVVDIRQKQDQNTDNTEEKIDKLFEWINFRIGCCDVMDCGDTPIQDIYLEGKKAAFSETIKELEHISKEYGDE